MPSSNKSFSLSLTKVFPSFRCLHDISRLLLFNRFAACLPFFFVIHPSPSMFYFPLYSGVFFFKSAQALFSVKCRDDLFICFSFDFEPCIEICLQTLVYRGFCLSDGDRPISGDAAGQCFCFSISSSASQTCSISFMSFPLRQKAFGRYRSILLPRRGR